MRRAASAGATVLPVDSRPQLAPCSGHGRRRRQDVRRVILTASGGPFRTWTAAAIRRRRAEAERSKKQKAHQLVDGAEGHDRFSQPDEQGPRTDRGPPSVRARSRKSTCWCIRNRSCMAWSNSATARSSPSSAAPTCASRSPIAWPGRRESTGPLRGSAPRAEGTLTFESPDMARFPALGLARRALEAGGGAPTVLNAANEVAVAAFLSSGLGFGGIAALVEATLAAAATRLLDPGAGENRRRCTRR